jgi:peptide/nickel transport system permease protein
VSVRAWLALLGAACLAWLAVRAARRRAAGTPAGRRFFRSPFAGAGIAVLAFFAVVAVAAPLVAPFDPDRPLDIVGLANHPPSWSHLLGTDLYSRDLWSRLVYGARVSLGIGALAMAVALTLGAAVGAAAGYFRRATDVVLMRIVDVGLAMPRLFILIVAVSVWQHVSLAALTIVLGLTGWFGTSRLVRAEVLSLRERDFVTAARALGAGSGRVIFRHVLPNVASPLLVSAALGIGNVMLTEAGLSFLGIGVRPPTASWGNMIADGANQIVTAPWTTLFPGLAIALVVMALNATGDALRDALASHQASYEEET